MYYRTKYVKPVSQKLSLYNYLKNTVQYQSYKDKDKRKDQHGKIVLREDVAIYNFDDVMDYYDSRDEFKYVGIVDKELSRRKSKQLDEMKDVFKIREKRAKVLEKKRGTGIPSLKGAVCSTSKNKEYLERIAKLLKVDLKTEETRTDICDRIKDKMLALEKYSTTADGNKLTYVMIPSNHPVYKFPYNLEDRVDFIIKKLKNQIKIKLDISVKTKKKAGKEGKGIVSYAINIKDNPKLREYDTIIKGVGGELTGGEWLIIVE
jgi:hypothetical protein